MTEQTKAERLADELAVHAHHAMNGEAYNAAIDDAAELLRLHALNGELLEALKNYVDGCSLGVNAAEVARAAIKKAGEKV
jgi:hypothetical protein